ncbi:hypothetical protein Glove_340g72 [Diversispora epigaea]|uniref:BTB domain-containing protein n=1 Tax=Diversispora epigaea TaxID=1348612 RepID=A0A397HHF3_9GLOM|nr:hypothetical protein Glove_340g72 [Diversispora epigaea]
MSSIFQADIIEDYKQLYESEEGYDVKIYIGEDENDLDELHAHSVVLRSHFDLRIEKLIKCIYNAPAPLSTN